MSSPSSKRRLRALARARARVIPSDAPVASHPETAEEHSSAAYYSGTVNVSGKIQAKRYAGSFGTARTFDVSGVRPVLGRTFRAGEGGPSGEKVVVISYPLW